ncbi:MAG TPA: hypothetical protein VJX69_15085 [Terriglobales bacterium]|nr:hypothetical protein [Terriglobales bacterium]
MMRRNLVLTLFVVTVLGTGVSQRGVSKQPEKLTIAIENVKQLLLVMDTKNGKISKQEWMRFMEAEFDRLDTEKKGELDQSEMRQSTVYVKQARSSDLGR